MSRDLTPEVEDRARREMQLALNSPQVMACMEEIHQAGFIVMLTTRRALEAANQLHRRTTMPSGSKVSRQTTSA